MNFFFGIKNKFFQSTLTIPIFNNDGRLDKNLSLFSARPKNNEWYISKLNLKIKHNFFILQNEIIHNNAAYFLAYEQDVNNLQLKKKLLKINQFTNTSPIAYRSNLKINLFDGGMSSYQSDYPYSMTTRMGNIVSPIMNLLNKNTDQNYIIFRNIYFLPTEEKSKIYLINVKKKRIIYETFIKANNSNLIKIDEKFINKDVYLYSAKLLGIPIFLSAKDKHLSLEHTHPPHHYILSNDKYVTVKKFKKKITDILNLNV